MRRLEVLLLLAACALAVPFLSPGRPLPGLTLMGFRPDLSPLEVRDLLRGWGCSPEGKIWKGLREGCLGADARIEVRLTPAGHADRIQVRGRGFTCRGRDMHFAAEYLAVLGPPTHVRRRSTGEVTLAWEELRIQVTLADGWVESSVWER